MTKRLTRKTLRRFLINELALMINEKRKLKSFKVSDGDLKFSQEQFKKNIDLSEWSKLLRKYKGSPAMKNIDKAIKSGMRIAKQHPDATDEDATAQLLKDYTSALSSDNFTTLLANLKKKAPSDFDALSKFTGNLNTRLASLDRNVAAYRPKFRDTSRAISRKSSPQEVEQKKQAEVVTGQKELEKRQNAPKAKRLRSIKSKKGRAMNKYIYNTGTGNWFRYWANNLAGGKGQMRSKIRRYVTDLRGDGLEDPGSPDNSSTPLKWNNNYMKDAWKKLGDFYVFEMKTSPKVKKEFKKWLVDEVDEAVFYITRGDAASKENFKSRTRKDFVASPGAAPSTAELQRQAKVAAEKERNEKRNK